MASPPIAWTTTETLGLGRPGRLSGVRGISHHIHGRSKSHLSGPVGPVYHTIWRQKRLHNEGADRAEGRQVSVPRHLRAPPHGNAAHGKLWPDPARTTSGAADRLRNNP